MSLHGDDDPSSTFQLPPDAAQGNAESLREFLRDPDADLDLPSLDGADVGSVDAGMIGEGFLGKAELLTVVADRETEPFFDGFLHDGLANPVADDYATDDHSTDDRLHHGGRSIPQRKSRMMTNGSGKGHGPKPTTKGQGSTSEKKPATPPAEKPKR